MKLSIVGAYHLGAYRLQVQIESSIDDMEPSESDDSTVTQIIQDYLASELANFAAQLRGNIAANVKHVLDTSNTYSHLPIILGLGVDETNINSSLLTSSENISDFVTVLQNLSDTTASSLLSSNEEIAPGSGEHLPLSEPVYHGSSDGTQHSSGTILYDHGSTIVGGHGPGYQISNHTCHGGVNCIPGLLLPLWHPTPPEAPVEERVTWAIIFILFMIYMFIGMSIVSDIFVCAIEKITSQKRRVKVVSKTTGKVEYINVPIWNETVAHLTMHVFGSCAPEIMLSVIEVMAHHFSPGELGPGTIVGAGAYNIFIIQAICIGSVTRGKSKRIHELRIYFITAAWAIFAYIWLYIILEPSSKGVIEIWEGVVTLLFYPLFIISAYIVDKRFFGLFSKKGKSSVTPMIRVDELRSGTSSPVPASTTSSEASAVSNERTLQQTNEAIEKVEQRYMEIFEEIRASTPNKTNDEIHQITAVRLLKELPKGHAYYRMQTSRGIAGGGDVINVKKLQEILAQSEEERQRNAGKSNKQIIEFDPDVYMVMEDVGVFYVNVARRGAGLENITTVDYCTKDGTGKAGIDYGAAQGTVVFNKGEKLKQIPIHLIDDDEFTNDNEFYLELSNPKLIFIGQTNNDIQIALTENPRATIKKMDDDQGGAFHFEHEECKIEENIGEAHLKIARSCGVKGRVTVPFKITPITALPFVHYEEFSNNFSSVTFEPRQTEQTVRLKITNEGKLKKEKTFKIELGEPNWSVSQRAAAISGSLKPVHKTRSKAPASRHASAAKYEISEEDEGTGGNFGEETALVSRLGRPRLGLPASMTVTICESSQLRTTLDELLNIGTNVGDLVATTTYREQFKNAIALHGDQDNETGRIKEPTIKNYVAHVVTIFWKVVFATIPPISIGNGWVTAFCALIYVGGMTAVIGDLASQLGCTIGLRDELTAITLVALGTSLPDMFASRLAAIREETADSAIGHVNGAVAVNVFLGLGLSWTVAAIYHKSVYGVDMRVPPGPLAFSFTIFLTFAVACIVIILLRRLAPVHGELGGPVIIRTLTIIFFVGLWITYVVLSALENYCSIVTF